MITVLAMGQSNAQGWQAGGDWLFDPEVTVWNNLGNVNSGDVGSAFAVPTLAANPFKSDGSNNMMIQACQKLHERTGRPVRLILVAQGGRPISDWSDGTTRGVLYSRMQAVLAAAGVAKVDAFLWHQGEQDNGSSGNYSAYKARFESLLGFMRSDGYLSQGTPVVIGTPYNTYTNIIPVLEQIAGQYPEIALADIRNLAVAADNVHFTGASLVVAGAVYEARLAELMQLV